MRKETGIKMVKILKFTKFGCGKWKIKCTVPDWVDWNDSFLKGENGDRNGTDLERNCELCGYSNCAISDRQFDTCLQFPRRSCIGWVKSIEKAIT